MRDRAVSVVIPTHQRPRLLSQSLRSVLAQRDVDVEVIVVDDGSARGSVNAVVPRNDERVRLIRHEAPRGVSEARNSGVRAASADWVAFLDDDDLWAPGKLAAQLDALARAADCQWSYAGVVMVNDDLRIIGWAEPPEERDIAVPMLIDDVLSTPSGVLAARALLAEAGPFDPSLSCCADWDMFLRLAQRSPLVSVHRPLLAYRVHPSAMTADVDACLREFDVIGERYAALRRAHGVSLDRATWERWKAATDLRAGKRWRSLRTLFACARTDGDWYGFARSAVVTALPGGVRLRDRRQARTVPVAWRSEAESWLAPFRDSADR